MYQKSINLLILDIIIILFSFIIIDIILISIIDEFKYF